MNEHDPRWEWIEVTGFGDSSPRYVKGQCNHLDTAPVYAQNQLDRELGSDPGSPVAHLCLTCNAQLPAEWRRA